MRPLPTLSWSRRLLTVAVALAVSVALVPAASAHSTRVAAPASSVDDGTGVVTGRITYADGTYPLETAQVNAYLPSTDTDPAGWPVATASADETGTYELQLEPGTYVLQVIDEWNSFEDTWIGSSDNTRVNAEHLTIAAGQRVTRNQEVLSWRDVSLTIHNDAFPLSYPDNGFNMYYYLFDPDSGTWGEKTAATHRVAGGRYVLPQDGRYRFLVEPTYTESWLPTFSGNTRTFHEAQDVLVTRDAWPSVSVDVLMTRQLRALSEPTVTGSGWVGEPLTGHDAAWEAAPHSWNRVWVRDDGQLLAGNGSSYVPTADDVGHRVHWEVTGHRPDFEPTTVSSGSVLIQSMEVAGTPRVKGRPVAGARLRARSSWSHPATTRTYQWFRGRTKIRGATSAVYRARVADVGHRLTVKMTGTTAEGRSGSTQARTKRIKARSTIEVSRRAYRSNGRRLTRFTATLRMPGCCTTNYGGRRFTVTLGTRTIVSGPHVHKQKLRWRTPRKVGTYTYRVRFVGTRHATPVTRKVRVRVRH